MLKWEMVFHDVPVIAFEWFISGAFFNIKLKTLNVI